MRDVDPDPGRIRAVVVLAENMDNLQLDLLFDLTRNRIFKIAINASSVEIQFWGAICCSVAAHWVMLPDAALRLGDH